MSKTNKPIEFNISKIKPLPLPELDADKIAKDHEQFEAWLRGETDDPPEIMKIKPGTLIPEIPPGQGRE